MVHSIWHVHPRLMRGADIYLFLNFLRALGNRVDLLGIEAIFRIVQAEEDAFGPVKENRSTPRRWGVNGRFLTRKMTGVDCYAMEILRAINSFFLARNIH